VTELQPHDDLAAVDEPAPVLVLFADPDARVDLGRPILGSPIACRLASAARDAGFSKILAGPGLAARPEGAGEIGVGEQLDQPALLAWEGSYFDPTLLRLMIEHPLEADERFAIYDELGRPAGCFCGRLELVPALVPVAEELDLPPPHGSASVVRVVDPEDVARAVHLVARCETRLDLDASVFNRVVALRSLSWLAAAGLTLAQLELISLVLVAACAPFLLLLDWAGLILAGLVLVLGVHVSRLLRSLGELSPRARLAGEDDGYAPGETLAELVRPVGHAVFIGASTYLMIDPVDRSSVAALVLLAAGGSAVLLSVARARHLLRRGAAERLALPRMERMVARLGLRLPGPLVQAPLLELAVVLSCLFGHVGVPWTICVVAAATRLWPWFVAPVESARPLASGR
jgi:hypothetical protein